MREIKFRAKQVDTGEWLYGDLLQPNYERFLKNKDIGNFLDEYKISILEKDFIRNDYVIDPETIGQFTGLCDKNGKEIYEGDIVLTQPIKNKPYSKSAKAKRRVGKVVWNSGKRDGSSFITEPTFIIEFIDNENDYRCWNWSLFYDCEVIGNIYDNPELLKGE